MFCLLVREEQFNVTGANRKLNAKEIPVYSVHIDELQKVACNMHMESYKLYNKLGTIYKEQNISNNI